HGIRLAVKNLQHFYFFLVLLEKLLERLHHAQRPFANGLRGASLEQPVLTYSINDLLVTLFYTEDEVAQRRVRGDGLSDLLQEPVTRLGDVLVCRFDGPVEGAGGLHL